MHPATLPEGHSFSPLPPCNSQGLLCDELAGGRDAGLVCMLSPLLPDLLIIMTYYV